jgi:hypothetical protein
MRPADKKSTKRDVVNMRSAISDLKKRCNSTRGKVKVVNGRKIHKMLYSIKEREEIFLNSESSDDSKVIGESDNLEIKKIYQSLHKNLKQFSIGADSKSEYILSEQKLNVQRISEKLKKLNSQEVVPNNDNN